MAQILTVFNNSEALPFFLITIFFSCLTSARRIITDKRFDECIGRALRNRWFWLSCVLSSFFSIVAGLILFEQGLWKEYTLTNAVLLGLLTVPILESVLALTRINTRVDSLRAVDPIEVFYRVLDTNCLMSVERALYDETVMLLRDSENFTDLEQTFRHLFSQNQALLDTYQQLAADGNEEEKKLFLITAIRKQAPSLVKNK